MAVEIKVPALGESVTEATIAKWFKAVGDAVAVDEALVELETDKVTVEVNAPVAGALKSIAAAEGADVAAGALLGVDTYVLPAERRHADTDRPMKAVRTIFTAHITGGELRPEQDGSTDEARWFTLDEVASLDRVSVVDIGLGFAGLR